MGRTRITGEANHGDTEGTEGEIKKTAARVRLSCSLWSAWF